MYLMARSCLIAYFLSPLVSHCSAPATRLMSALSAQTNPLELRRLPQAEEKIHVGVANLEVLGELLALFHLEQVVLVDIRTKDHGIDPTVHIAPPSRLGDA